MPNVVNIHNHQEPKAPNNGVLPALLGLLTLTAFAVLAGYAAGIAVLVFQVMIG